MSRSAASILLEDLLVARARFSRAQQRTRLVTPGRRPRRSRSVEALRDMDHHRADLERRTAWFNAAGGDAAVDVAGLRAARSIARDRMKSEIIYHRNCGCHGCPVAER